MKSGGLRYDGIVRRTEEPSCRSAGIAAVRQTPRTTAAVAKPSQRLMLSCRHDRAPAIAETDAAEALALAVRAQDHRVAIQQESARFAIGEGHRLLAAGTEFEQRAGLLRLRAGQRAGPEQVAAFEPAAIHRVVRHQLG